jgi:hypothetical protein
MTSENCRRCGRSLTVEGDYKLSTFKETAVICFPCMKEWLEHRDRQVRMFLDSTSFEYI